MEDDNSFVPKSSPKSMPLIGAKRELVVIVYDCLPWGQPIRGLNSGEFLGTMELIAPSTTLNLQTHHIFLKVALLYFIPL